VRKQRKQGERLMNTQSTWPHGPAWGWQHSPDDNTDEQVPLGQAQQDQGPAHALIGEMAGLLRETRGNVLAGGGALGSITIGIALEAGFAARALQPGAFRLINIGLMLGLILCWLRAATLLALAGRPVLNALSELRWQTGSPLDPRAEWLTLPPVGANPDQWTWIRAHLLLGAARLARYRVQLADTWTYVTVSYFAVWTALIIIGF
jgi:hypothetical protein